MHFYRGNVGEEERDKHPRKRGRSSDRDTDWRYNDAVGIGGGGVNSLYFVFGSRDGTIFHSK